MAPARLIHTAQALVDNVINLPTLPQRGQNTVARSQAFYAGGAVTVLIAAARSGAQCLHAGSVGTGPNGQLVIDALTSNGVAISSPLVEEIDTGVCLVFVEATAERTFVTVQGAERRVSVESLATSQPQAGDYVCLSGYTLQGQTREPLLAWLANLPTGVEVVLDPGSAFAELDQATQLAALAATTIWTSNAEEAEALTSDPAMVTSAAKVSQFLTATAMAIVRDGPAGCAIHVNHQTAVIPSYPQKAIDTNGAGDTHTGVMMAGLLQGLDPVEAARRANAAGAIKVTRAGLAATPRRDEIDAFLADQLADQDGGE